MQLMRETGRARKIERLARLSDWFVNIFFDVDLKLNIAKWWYQIGELIAKCCILYTLNHSTKSQTCHLVLILTKSPTKNCVAHICGLITCLNFFGATNNHTGSALCATQISNVCFYFNRRRFHKWKQHKDKLKWFVQRLMILLRIYLLCVATSSLNLFESP